MYTKNPAKNTTGYALYKKLGIYISVGTTELYQSEELCQAAIYCLVFIRADTIQQLRCHPERGAKDSTQ